jgi:hypothetical protein
VRSVTDNKQRLRTKTSGFLEKSILASARHSRGL